MGTLCSTPATAHTSLLAHLGLARRVLLHLAPSAAAAHSNVLDRPAEAGLLMALEVAQGDKYVGLHNGLADLGGLDARLPPPAPPSSLPRRPSPMIIWQPVDRGEKPFS